MYVLFIGLGVLLLGSLMCTVGPLLMTKSYRLPDSTAFCSFLPALLGMIWWPIGVTRLRLPPSYAARGKGLLYQRAVNEC